MDSVTQKLKQNFIEMVEAQDNAQRLRLAGQDFIKERARAARLEDFFNEKMKGLNREDQKTVIYLLHYDGLLSAGIGEAMEVFNGTFASISTVWHKVALKALESVPEKLDYKEVLQLAASNVKHMGYSWDDFYKIMAEVRKILRIS